eukprot:g4536.t1
MEVAARRSRQAALALAQLPTSCKNDVLRAFKAALAAKKDEILKENAIDVAEAEKLANAGKLSQTLVRRLNLGGAKFDGLLEGLDQVISLEDPVGKCTYANRMAEGLEVYRVTCPIGVMCVIFEARPEACVQIASLALKSGNALLLKGGKEASRSNRVLVDTLRGALDEFCKSYSGAASDDSLRDSLQLLEAREDVAAILKMDQHIDLVVPRGGNALVRYIKENTMIPVLGHADGICAVYVDDQADPKKAAKIVFESKTGYVSACNAMETLLLHEKIVQKDEFMRELLGRFVEGNENSVPSVEFRCCEQSKEPLQKAATAASSSTTASPSPSTPKAKITSCDPKCDYDTEFLDYIAAVKTVRSVDEAIAHINAHGSKHTDCIVTENPKTCEKFMSGVDSADVFCNASTRFADGFRFGFGAEIGISTNRIHSRGPVGLDGLVLYKYRVYGDGHVVAETKFAHERMAECENGEWRVEDLAAKRRKVMLEGGADGGKTKNGA